MHTIILNIYNVIIAHLGIQYQCFGLMILKTAPFDQNGHFKRYYNQFTAWVTLCLFAVNRAVVFI